MQEGEAEHLSSLCQGHRLQVQPCNPEALGMRPRKLSQPVAHESGNLGQVIICQRGDTTILGKNQGERHPVCQDELPRWQGASRTTGESSKDSKQKNGTKGSDTGQPATWLCVLPRFGDLWLSERADSHPPLTSGFGVQMGQAAE